MHIQNPNRKISIIAPRFCNEEELERAKAYHQPLLYHTALWSIKESIFKVFGEDLPFAEQILVKDFDPEKSDLVEVNCIHRSQAFHFNVGIHREGEYFVVMAFLEH
jgi:phosphopantetheinyl transferase (holo-ACP synthase)